MSEYPPPIPNYRMSAGNINRFRSWSRSTKVVVIISLLIGKIASSDEHWSKQLLENQITETTIRPRKVAVIAVIAMDCTLLTDSSPHLWIPLVRVRTCLVWKVPIDIFMVKVLLSPQSSSSSSSQSWELYLLWQPIEKARNALFDRYFVINTFS